MFSQIPLLQIYQAMARHAAESQSVSAENIAHAGQPGFRSMRLESFESFMSRVSADPQADFSGADVKTLPTGDPMSPNGNSVSIEAELLRSASAAGQHQMALTVYSKSMDLLRASLGRR